jgi:hypothetical protein
VTEAERPIIERAEALAGNEFAAQVAVGRGQTVEEALTKAMPILAGQAAIR